MKENKYDDPVFFEKYSQMDRSKYGLTSAGEWNALRELLPDFKDKTILDLGCGYGWHCQYALAKGAKHVVGVDISQMMLEKARNLTPQDNVEYLHMPIEDIDFEKDRFDIVISSLVFHYIASFDDMCKRIAHCLKKGGSFVFSVEHPVFTAEGNQDWVLDASGQISHWPVDGYFDESVRNAYFLEEKIQKYHRTITSYFSSLTQHGFCVKALVEPQPTAHLLETVAGMKDELRRPMMLLFSANKE